MKALLAIAGVGLVGAAVFFIARGRRVPTTQGTQMSGNVGQPPSSRNIAASLLTSQNLATLGGLAERVFGTGSGGAVAVAPPGGQNGSMFVTTYN